jgi:hypothetical protein
LTPLVQLKQPCDLPLIDTNTKADCKITWIQLQNTLLKPNLLRTFKRKGHSRVSKGFTISIFKAKLPPKDLLCKRLVASDAIQRQSLMFLSWTKPLCSSEIIEGRIEVNLSAMIFDIMLNWPLI